MESYELLTRTANDRLGNPRFIIPFQFFDTGADNYATIESRAKQFGCRIVCGHSLAVFTTWLSAKQIMNDIAKFMEAYNEVF